MASQVMANSQMPPFITASEMSQTAPVFDRMIVATPSFEWCGGASGVACPELTAKTLDVAPQFTVPRPEQTKKGRFVIRFKFDRSDIAPKTASWLKSRMPVLLQAKSLKIKGYTDNIGKERYNDRLAQKRAKAVRRMLVSHGMDPDIITIEADGKCCYAQENKTSNGRRANRRAEVEVIITMAITNDI